MFTISRPTPDAPPVLHLNGDLTIYEVQQAHEQLMALLPTQDPAWQLDLSGIEELDSAGAQLLLAVHQALSSAGTPATVIASSANVIELADLLALDVLQPIASAED